jgi:hypothetical protein
MVEHQVSTLGTRVRFPPPALSVLRAILFSNLKTVERETGLAFFLYGAIQKYGGFERPEWLG